MCNDALLKIENLKTYFYTSKGVVKAINGIDFELEQGRVLGIVGESGCGKSVTALSIINFVKKPGKIIRGHIYLNGVDILKIPQKEMRKIRGRDISMIFQDSMTALNPIIKVGTQIIETILAHEKISKKEAVERAINYLKIVGLKNPKNIMNMYSFQLSGGMRQKVMIAVALSLNPKILIADEPTTALDVTVQAQILKEIKKMKNQFNTAVIMISHDFGVIAEIADDVAVMYGGRIIEYGNVNEVINHPIHPYTRLLIKSIPKIGKKCCLKGISGHPPSLIDLPEGCIFTSRCPMSSSICNVCQPEIRIIGKNRKVACHMIEDKGETNNG